MPFPVPEAPEVMVRKLELLDAVQAQEPALGVTVSDPVLAVAGAAAGRLTMNVHEGGAEAEE